jgi:hypothetical protein
MAKNKLYKKKKWKKLDGWQCDLCHVHVLNERKMKDHVLALHFKEYVAANPPDEVSPENIETNE